jgi:hypothetical protein
MGSPSPIILPGIDSSPSFISYTTVNDGMKTGESCQFEKPPAPKAQKLIDPPSACLLSQ